MCGIVGVLNRNGAPVAPRVLERMMLAQRHRGPDDQGMHLFSLRAGKGRAYDETVPSDHLDQFEGGLGFNRLSILDLSANGHQPMASADGSVILAFNGEIYNAFSYKSELQSAGYRFRSKTDTEVLLYLYQRHGLEAMLDRLNGMFAICIVDLNRQCLFLARDRLGIKPLYCYERNGTFLFASEVKTFLQHPEFTSRLKQGLLDEQFMFRYCSGGGFLLDGVSQIEPGHWLRLDTRHQESRRYWTIPSRDPSLEPPTFKQGVASLSDHLHRSVDLRLLSDVKLGCQLSGGIDSSLITTLAASTSGADIDAISIIFRDPTYSEEEWIDQVASQGGIHVHKSVLDSDYFFDNLQRATWCLDQPLNHPNSIGIFRIAQCAKPLMKVLLSGEGADELLGGYARFAYAAFRPRIRSLLPLLRRLPGVGARIWRQFGYAERLDAPDWFITSSAYMTMPNLMLLRPDADPLDVISRRRAIFDEGAGDYLENCLRYELRTYLVDLLVRQDKMTMAHSIENRVPFLDHELVEYVRHLPSDHLVRPSCGWRAQTSRNTKRPLKQLATEYFGSQFAYRTKGGFALPLRTFFSDARFGTLMEDVLLPGMRQRGVVDPKVVEGWWRELAYVPSETVEALWMCTTFELWAQQFVDGNGPVG